MKYLGIDFGEKRVGLAFSDEAKTIAFPFEVFENNKSLVSRVGELCSDHDIELVVIGESRDYSGKENKIMGQVKDFKAKLENDLKLKTVFHPEFLTSMQAERLQGKNHMLDASAAAIILQSYMDTVNNHNGKK